MLTKVDETNSKTGQINASILAHNGLCLKKNESVKSRFCIEFSIQNEQFFETVYIKLLDTFLLVGGTCITRD